MSSPAQDESKDESKEEKKSLPSDDSREEKKHTDKDTDKKNKNKNKNKKNKKKKKSTSPANKSVLVLLLTQKEPCIRRMTFKEFSKMRAIMGPVFHGRRLCIHIHPDNHTHHASQHYDNDFANFVLQGHGTSHGPCIIVLNDPSQLIPATSGVQGAEKIVDMTPTIASFITSMYREHVDTNVHISDPSTVTCSDHRHQKPLVFSGGLLLI